LCAAVLALLSDGTRIMLGPRERAGSQRRRYVSGRR
jgi:hypothetical protein